MTQQRKTLTQLFVPIAFETLFFMLTGMVDTFMLSYVGDDAVGAVGTANTYISVFIIMFNIISSGMIAVMTQYIGAKKIGIAYQARQIGIVFNSILGILLSLFLFFFSGTLLNVIGIADGLMEYAKNYLQLVGSFCFVAALTPIFSSYLRAFGFTKEPMAATVSANLLNIILNSVFLFGFDMGVTGVALATVISRLVNLIVVIILSGRSVHAKKEPDRLPTKQLLGQIIRIGLPSACETALYNVAMTFVVRFLNQMDAEGLNATARVYASTVTNFSYCVGASLAQANAIITGWSIGSGDYKSCYRKTRKAALIGVAVAAVLEALIAILAPVYMNIFTDNPEMVALVQKLLFIDIVLEIGRVSNLVYGQALKTSGDAVFPTVLAAIFMYVCAVGGTYFFGIYQGLLVVGAYIGMACDECVRAIGMYLRFRSGKWEEKGFIEK